MNLREIKVNEDLIGDLDKLTDVIVDVLKANKHEVINKYRTGRKGIHIDCDGFILEAYSYSFLKAINIWIFCTLSETEAGKYDALIKQFKLMGFVVYTTDDEDKNKIPFIKNIQNELDGMD